MLKFENTETYGWEAAVRGMRNPMNSWSKQDSVFVYPARCRFTIGDDDLKLMKSLRKAGSDHRKFLRFITVTVDITAPLYWWKEFDTYKVGTVANSCSTMHKIQAKEFTLDDFSHEHLEGVSVATLHSVVGALNIAREAYLLHKDKKYWWQMIQLLPTSYNQLRTIQLNYEVLNNICRTGRRLDHKLDEWRVDFMNWAKSLPYADELIFDAQDAQK